MRSSERQLEAGPREGAVAVLDPCLVGRQRLRQAVLRERFARICVDRVGPGRRERQNQSATSGRPSQPHRCLWALSDFVARPQCAWQPRAWRVSPRRPRQRAGSRPRGGRGTSHMLLRPAPRVADGVRRHPVVLGTVDASQPDAATRTRPREGCRHTGCACLLVRRRARWRTRVRAAP